MSADSQTLNEERRRRERGVLSTAELFPQTEVKPYPDWVFVIIVLLCVLPVISIPLVALYQLICCTIMQPSARTDQNTYCNDAFEEIQEQGQRKQRA